MSYLRWSTTTLQLHLQISLHSYTRQFLLLWRRVSTKLTPSHSYIGIKQCIVLVSWIPLSVLDPSPRVSLAWELCFFASEGCCLWMTLWKSSCRTSLSSTHMESIILRCENWWATSLDYPATSDAFLYLVSPQRKRLWNWLQGCSWFVLHGTTFLYTPTSEWRFLATPGKKPPLHKSLGAISYGMNSLFHWGWTAQAQTWHMSSWLRAICHPTPLMNRLDGLVLLEKCESSIWHNVHYIYTNVRSSSRYDSWVPHLPAQNSQNYVYVEGRQEDANSHKIESKQYYHFLKWWLVMSSYV